MEEENIKLHEQIMIRVESDDYALLYNPDTDERFVLDPVAVYICNNLKGQKSLSDILEGIKNEFEGTPDDAAKKISIFVKSLLDNNLAFSYNK